MRDGSEEGDAAAQEDGYAGDDQPMDQAGGEELLDDLSAVDVEVARALAGEVGDDLRRCSRHGLNVGRGRLRHSERPMRQDDHRLDSVEPLVESSNHVEGVAPHDERIDRVEELAIALITLPGALDGREPVEPAIFAGDEAVEAGGDVDGCCRVHCAAGNVAPRPVSGDGIAGSAGGASAMRFLARGHRHTVSRTNERFGGGAEVSPESPTPDRSCAVNKSDIRRK
jgi:hypothetical protein